jgi:hypothetical protein
VSETLERGAEIIKLARLLGVEPKELGYLEQIPAAALRTFRAQTTDRLFAGDAGRLHRVAAASKLVPVPLTVKIAQAAFGPLLCSATAGQLEPRHAVKVASKCPTSFLADIAITLDPRRAPDVIAAVPTPLVVAVAKELIARDEHVTMGRFVSFLKPETLRAAVPEIPDDADLLKVAFVMEGKDKLDDLLDIARDRFPALIRTAHRENLWAEALDLVGNLSLENRAQLGDIAAAQDDDLLNALVRAAQDLDAWDALLPITAAMSPDSLRRFADVPAVQEPEVLGEIIAVAIAGPLWVDLLPMTRYLTDAARARVAEEAAAQDDATLERLATEAHDAQMWDTLLPIALAFTPAARTRLAALPLLQRADVLRAAIDTAARHDLWDAVLPLVDALPDAAKPRIAACIGELDADQIRAALDAASRSQNLPTLVDIALRQEPAGRRRVLDIIAELDHVEEFGVLLTATTPQLVWDALVEVRAEVPDSVRTVIVDRAGALGRTDVVAQLTSGAVAEPTRKRPKPGGGAET